MPHSSTVSLLTYWRGLQSDPVKAPSRDRFDPGHLKSLIPQMIMISTADSGHRFRLSGGFLVAVHGYELRETSFTGLFRPPFNDALIAALQRSALRQQPLLITFSAPWQAYVAEGETADARLFHDETVRFEVCLCPMLNRYGKVDRMVGVYQSLSPMPANRHGTLGRYTLENTTLLEPEQKSTAGHLRLVVDAGQRVG